MTLRLRIGSDDDMVLDVGLGQNVLLPAAEDERVEAFQVLSNALALLCGLNPERLSAVKAGDPKDSPEDSEQCPADHRS
jgi:hypothetical protein